MLHDIGFMLFVLLLATATILTLWRGGLTLNQQAKSTSSPSTNAPSPPQAPISFTVVRAQAVHLYPFPHQGDVGLMQPAVDAQGNVWVGEMYANRLARLDSGTGQITTWEPPHGNDGIMDTTVDAHGMVWFVEQDANYIGRFNPLTQTFRVFPLGIVSGRPLGPQDLQFDRSGKLWFTAPTAGRIGRLDPVTGEMRLWTTPAPGTSVPSYPFALTVTSNGQVWFGDLTGGAVGHLDPGTGKTTLYHLANAQAQVFSIAADTRGRIWFTEIVPGQLGMVDLATNKVTEWEMPSLAGRPSALYEMAITHNGDIWFANNGTNTLVRYSPNTARYTFFQLPASSSGLYGLVRDASGTLWFTLDNSSVNAVGKMTP
jgi:virginiamycin B lyase